MTGYSKEANVVAGTISRAMRSLAQMKADKTLTSAAYAQRMQALEHLVQDLAINLAVEDQNFDRAGWTRAARRIYL